MIEELPPIPENAPLPSLLSLYSRDLRYTAHLSRTERHHYLTDFNPEMKQAFIESCLWLVTRIVQNICTQTPNFWRYAMDFIQEGNMGLMDAVEHAPTQLPFEDMVHFHRYAARYIRGYIYEYYNHLPLIYISRISRRRAYAKEEDPEKCKEAFMTLQDTVSLETLLTEEEFDLPDLTSENGDKNKQGEVERLLSCLSINERRVVMLHYGLEDGIAYHFREIAAMLSIGFSSARRLHDTALKRITGNITSYVRERHVQEREERFIQLLADWQAKGVKITVHQFRKAAQCDMHAATRFLREQGVLRRYTPLLADPTSSHEVPHHSTNEGDQGAQPTLLL